ncbi:nucleotidyltransferase family protein [Diplocloster agilis]|uniref:nucleotidyltransferase family protein n=1 Tax=Diplocloster agilis TaxID=2850323 RepID=UPI0008224E86|nr:nucleotidyltransferase domain-containing protein [Suonthocola fibrivorans]MCU6736910.1 nucleotidyltransferase domain-containing protein [Suonthocola fibrivorans]SCJ94403.1 Predicted nucleotidyltransferases [uncultured Clostridium sp.]
MNQAVYDELVAGILEILTSSVNKIILYGSVARGTNTDDSDVDIALLMKGKLDAKTEDKLSDFIVEMNLKYDRVFSVIDIDIELYQRWMHVLPFYANVEREGIVLWKAA